MEQQVKERLVGAAVLVAIAVALIPELLSGRKTAAPEPAIEAEAGRRTYTIELKPPDPAAATSARAESPPHPGLVLPKPAEEKAAASAGSTDDSGAAGVTTNDTDPEPQTPPEPASKSPAVPGPSPAAIASKSSGASASTAGSTSAVTVPATGGASGVAVQVGAFGNEQAAQKLVRDLQGRGYTAWIAPLQKNGKTLHRVRVGPAPDKVAAAELAQRLKQDGLPATVVGGG